MPANYVPQVLRYFFPEAPLAGIISTLTYVPKYFLTKALDFVRHAIPTVDNVAVAYEKSTDIGHIVKTTAYDNLVLYGLPVMGVKLLFEPALRTYVPFVYPAFIYFDEGVLLVLAATTLSSNIFYNIALTQAATKYLPKTDEELPDCNNCASLDSIGDDIANILLYASFLGAASTLNLFSGALPENLIWLLQAAAYGSSLASLQYSARGVCLAHYSTLLNNNKIYYVSLGAMVIYSVKQTSAYLSKMTGMQQNYYVDDVIFSLLWQQAILLMVLQSKSPDYLNACRSAIKEWQATTLNYALNYRIANKKRDYVTKLYEFLTHDGLWLLQRRPVQLALNVNQKKLLAIIESLEWLHENRLAKLALDTSTLVIDSLPKKLTGKAGIISDILQQQDWQKLAGFVRNYLHEVEARREIDENGVRIESFTLVRTYEGEQRSTCFDRVGGRLLSFFQSFAPAQAVTSPRSAANEDEFVSVEKDDCNEAKRDAQDKQDGITVRHRNVPR